MKYFIYLYLFLILYFSGNICWAKTASKFTYSFATLKATTLKKEKQCEMESKKYYDSGSMSRMNEGAELERKCLESIAEGIANKYYIKGAFGKNGIKDKLEKMSSQIFDLYYSSQQYLKPCGEDGCKAMMYETMALGVVNDWMSKYIIDMVDGIYENKDLWEDK